MPITVKKDSLFEFTEKKSVFIGQAFYAPTTEVAVETVASVSKKHPEATHVCWAYSVCSGTQRKASDDGEPSGTAGIPILHVIDLKSLTDTLVTVTRYFGGILLGAGGLVRAYTKAAAEALDAAGMTDIAEYKTVAISYPYELHGVIEKLLKDESAEVISRDFTDTVRITLELPSEKLAAIETLLGDRWYGKLSFELISSVYKRRI